ncbi:MAG: hypothetical protein IPM97_10000 [Bdellovibrionaceae bacterium]|nr:hypothetical protein [Pseudobdellovibrionaceae bacterium]
MKFGKSLAVLIMSALAMTAVTAKAQYMNSMAGTGYNPGQQGCAYQPQVAAGAASYLDEYNEIKKSMAEEKRRLSDMKRKQRQIDKELGKARDTIRGVVSDVYSDFIIEHMDSARLCSEYRGYGSYPVPAPEVPKPPAPSSPDDMPKVPYDDEGTEVNKDKKDRTTKKRRSASTSNEVAIDRAPAANETSSATGIEGGRSVAAPSSGGAQQGLIDVRGFTQAQWRQVCLPQKRGGVSGVVCENPYKSGEKSRYSSNECKKSLDVYREKTIESQKLSGQIQDSENLIARYKEDLPAAMKDAKERYKEDTESGICMDCMASGNGYITQRPGPDWAGVAANFLTAGTAMYMGYQNNKMVAEYNSDLGWPTQPYPTWGFGLPFMLNGIYGALGGGIGAGGFGCAAGPAGMGGMGAGAYGNVGMQGPYGYPQGMFGGQMGGGMYNGGFGPTGMAGPWGLGGGPGMGAGFSAGLGIGAGMPGMGGMYGGMPGMGGMYGGMPGMGGMYGGMGAGMPGMGGMYGGMGAGMPGMGGMYGGMPGMGGMYGGMPGMGGMYGGMPGMGGMYGGMPGMGGMYGGMPGMGGMGSPYGMGGAQYQQAMMQMQMQQYNMYMQQQQQAMQNQMARQQTLMGLQNELSQLMYRIQQVQMGVGSVGTGYIGAGASVGIGGGINIGGGTGNPSVPIPAPNSNMGNNPGGGATIIPSSGR